MKKPTDDKPELEFYGADQFKVDKKYFRNKYGDEFKFVIERGSLPSRFRERKLPRSPSPEAYQFIYDFLPEFERIWEAIKTLPGPLIGPKQSKITDKKEAALICFNNRSDWKCINKRVLESPLPWKWKREGHEKPEFRGKLLQELFEYCFPDYPSFGARTLEKIARSFETDQK